MNDDLTGTTLGHCVIERMLGQGGMARVYKGRQENLDRAVAIKVLPPYYAADPAFVERFKLEARAMARLSHPNIVTVHDAGEDQGRLYIIMEYIGGGTLKQRSARSMPLSEITRVIHEVAGALTYAASMGIIHRDVKPVNVLLDTSGRAVLSDFGIAKVLATSAALTQSGAGVGTPEYMSPEQCRGGSVDARSDIYALGVMLYEMLTGHTPFEADNYTALAHSHIYEPVPPPSRLNPRISLAVQAVVMKALEKDPTQRFQTATDMAITLEQAVAAQAPIGPMPQRQPVPAARVTAMPQPARAPVSLPLSVVCPRCRQPNAPTQRFCSACGWQLAPAPPTVAPPQYPRPQTTGSYVTCPVCHAPNQAINRFCTTCGQSLLAGVAGIHCRVCGKTNPAATRFCTACGHPLK
ncbi:MAG TPA: serine/threonine-protein kinase [Ktedonobacterales bacterium]|nr:serine/threonine-protein kinase [Ktedonobacterales bacterium]